MIEESLEHSDKFERIPREQNDPPLVAATPIPTGPTTIIDNAEAVNNRVAVAEAQVMDLSNRSGGSRLSYVESTPGSVYTQVSACSMLSHQTSSLSSFSATLEGVMSLDNSASHEVVHIDALEDSGHHAEANTGELTGGPVPLPKESDSDKQRELLQQCCRLYVIVALCMFITGSVGLSIVFAQMTGQDLQPGQVDPPQPMTPSTNLIPAPAPVSMKPTISIIPSAMPSCSGLFSQVSSVGVAQSGSNHFTMSEAGNTIVVANFDYQSSKSFLETFSMHGANNQVVRTEATRGYSIHDMSVSGDGSRLVLGVNSYPQAGNSSTEVGGALLQMERVVLGANDVSDWRVRHRVLTGGGFYGSVVKVAISYDGTTAAFVSDAENGFLIEVYGENQESGFFDRIGQPMNETVFDGNTMVELSGDGSRLFVASSDNSVKAYSYDDVLGEWSQVGDTMQYFGISPDVKSSHDGKILVLGSPFDYPVSVFEERSMDDFGSVGWAQVSTLDITKSSESQHVSISGDGRSVVVSETFASQPTVLRAFRRSGAVFAQVQDLTLPNGLYRGMTLNQGGEQLVVAIEESVIAYRRDCTVGN